MAITTYAELKTALADWSHRSDLTTKMGDFIVLAESRFNDALRIKAMNALEDLTAVLGSRFISFPTGMKKLNGLSLVSGTEWTPLIQLSASALDKEISDTQGEPVYYAITNKIEFDCQSNNAYTVTARVFTENGLSDSVTTNDLLAEYPNIYLFSSLVELFDYIGDETQSAKYNGKRNEAVKLANLNAHRSKAPAILTTELSRKGSFNIITDD
ncbi:phage adaptor protein [Solemya elarraichensis gill symbiont]|uniref:Uncharacterized protein n=1 Tax=Solemya elarraichensis gill symbiont TaxID=1918949 RepID=A0A1T2KZU4_9GAMM|nr:hypothetical protein [Solemya elarraichensis gill symbiont]OOZ38341.1 hypothetical protein BOW52_08750 [Solemya elarraichensis gill symbiont]